MLKKADFRYLENVWEENYDAVICMTQAIAHMHMYLHKDTGQKSHD